MKTLLNEVACELEKMPRPTKAPPETKQEGGLVLSFSRGLWWGVRVPFVGIG